MLFFLNGLIVVKTFDVLNEKLRWVVGGECFQLTRCKLGVLHLPVVGAAALVQPCVRGRAAVPQRAGAAAHGGVHGVKVLRTLEALVIIPISVQPPVAVLPLCVRYPQVPGQVSEQQAVQHSHHSGGFPASWTLQLHRSASVRVSGSSLRFS